MAAPALSTSARHVFTPGNVRAGVAAAPVALALGWNCARKALHWRPPLGTEKPRFRVTLDHLDQAASALLEPPWPDLILTIGRVALRWCCCG